MSRIEEALQKATMSRTRVPSAVSQEKQHVSVSLRDVPPVNPIPVDNPYVVTVNDPQSPATEEFRKLKSIVSKLAREDSPQNCIMVTSAVAGEGKSIVSLNLAITLAEEFDHTVLLIDGDLRRPSLHKYLGLEPPLGLRECLVEGRDVGDAIIRTGLGKLSLLPAGMAMNNPTELLSSQRTREIFTEIKNRYHDRYIIIDTPPALPFADSRIIGGIADSMVFVAREGVVSPEQVREAVLSLKEVPCLGLVYNDAHLSASSSFYGYRYGNNSSTQPVKKSGGFFSFMRGKGSR